jgi:hypothetical protein
VLGLATLGGSAIGGRAEALSAPTTLWTPPRTWVHAEVVTAALVNAHLRDNLLVLKTPRDSFGRLSELSSATLASLSSEFLTGLARAGGNAFTGRTRLSTGAGVRLIVPVGADKWAGTKGVDAGGSVWIEGDYIHHIASNHTTEYRWLGASLGAPGGGARAGSVWIEGAHLHYIDASLVERYIYALGTSGHSDAAALGGSLWAETYLHGIGDAGMTEYPFHADVLHGDGSTHSDSTSHDDTGVHTDGTTHDDGGAGHSDHTDGHADHTDGPGHADATPHTDYGDHVDHSDHADSGPHGDSTSHADHTDHTDSPAYNQPTVV